MTRTAHQPLLPAGSGRATVRICVACCALFFTALGLFEPADAFPTQRWVLLGALLGAALLRPGRLRVGRRVPPLLTLLAAPLLWTSVAWVAFRLLHPHLPHAVLLPAGVLVWLVALFPPQALAFPLLAVLMTEVALTARGFESAAEMQGNFLVYGLALGAALWARRVYSPARVEELARELRLPQTEEVRPGGTGIHPPVGDRPQGGEGGGALELQLEMLRHALSLTSAVLLTVRPGGDEFRLRAASSSRGDLLAGPFPRGGGIAGAVQRGGREIALAPLRENFPALPYYRSQSGVGALAALPVGVAHGETEASQLEALLCVDRVESAPWTEGERALLRLAAEKIGQDLGTQRRCLELERERNTLERVCTGLRELNSALGLETAFDATIQAVRALAPVDFVAITLLEGDAHFVVRAEGTNAVRLQGRRFPADEGLAGQVLKFNSALPEGGDYQGSSPVFSRDNHFADFRSLLIVPLRMEKGRPIGTLVVAAQGPRLFNRTLRQMFELIAAQVAVRIDLAQAHEKINRMATTDGLTGLANRRAFHHGFDVMINRARRRCAPLCLILADVDHFKRINDTYGHPFGDEVLREVARALSDVVRVVDLVARYGGEEFAVVLEDSDERGGRRMAERLRKAVEGLELCCGEEEVHVTISLGLSVFPRATALKEELVSFADQALYRAKQSGRNRLVSWHEASSSTGAVSPAEVTPPAPPA